MNNSDENILSQNSITIIDYIRRNNGKLTKIELAEKLKMPWSTVSTTIAKLKSLIKTESSNKNLYRGKLLINSSFKYYVGISVGHSKLKLVILDFSFHIVKVQLLKSMIEMKYKEFLTNLLNMNFNNSFEECKWCCDTPKSVEEILIRLREITQAINKLKDEKFNIDSIGFAFPGHIDYDNQKIIHSFQDNDDGGFSNTNIYSLLSASLMNELEKNKIKCFVDHNVKCSTVAEKEAIVTYRQNYDDKNILNVYLGIGISVGMILNNELYRGNNNLAGEYGKSLFTPDNPETLEQRLLIKVDSPDSEFIDLICTSLFNIVNILGIDKIVFSGKFDNIFNKIEVEMINKFVTMGKTGLSLIQSTYGEFSAAAGAAISCYNQSYNVPFKWN